MRCYDAQNVFIKCLFKTKKIGTMFNDTDSYYLKFIILTKFA